MKTFLKNIGLIIIFVGLGFVAVTSATTVKENTGLAIGIVLIVVGLLSYIILNKRIED